MGDAAVAGTVSGAAAAAATSTVSGDTAAATAPPPAQRHAGIGLRTPHAAALLAARPALECVEVHAENFFAAGGAAPALLDAARALWPVSLHGVGMGLGSAAGIDADHLERLAALVERVDPVRVSEHASFARAPRPGGAFPVHAGDLLPVAHTPAALDILAANVQRVQDRLRRRLLVENLAAYLRWADEEIAEPDFFNALVRRTGCGLLLDVNNLVVNALNAAGRDAHVAVAAACRWVDAIDAQAVGEIHLAGYADTGATVVDDHGSRVHAPVWAVYRHAVRRLGPRPTVVEWDTDLPELAVLLDEAKAAEAVIADVARAAAPAPAR